MYGLSLLEQEDRAEVAHVAVANGIGWPDGHYWLEREVYEGGSIVEDGGMASRVCDGLYQDRFQIGAK